MQEASNSIDTPVTGVSKFKDAWEYTQENYPITKNLTKGEIVRLFKGSVAEPNVREVCRQAIKRYREYSTNSEHILNKQEIRHVVRLLGVPDIHIHQL